MQDCTVSSGSDVLSLSSRDGKLARLTEHSSHSSLFTFFTSHRPPFSFSQYSPLTALTLHINANATRQIHINHHRSSQMSISNEALQKACPPPTPPPSLVR